ncbi:probable protein S-acyltransferase 12 isoform X1 [Hevea brasiliensis]|uniref:probable protein S-acyltransferase 12 isoform X3 n=1 Tax=Hevea brasiliensis TaxID=3981 RepID=UPI0025E64099|nr:probable protein S-acyltransferase 12 isoform X3 [Hevea brasiliensis]XP_057998997.1 probable protein S-acyltransferase 12 isoform X3 [Hevea brasiliensis]XP_057999007.1 probable protein S-acyltransferase 12 isoform X1 [Hevea brasiliensis]XP_057999008.1 probable protein S-acyltransferase 12 isoform X1 [Hevea brasiliensis]
MDVNVFKLCSGLKVLGYLMILLVAGIITVSYYAVVVITWGPQLLRGGVHSLSAILMVIVFHILLGLLLWSYFRVVLKDPGSVPENWRPERLEENLEGGSCINESDFRAPENLGSTWSAPAGLDRGPHVGYCNHCQNGKPPRCHHCSVCQRCVLKMDHHCVWVVNCVGARNYKFFLLFLVYEKKGAARWKYDLGRKQNFEQVFGRKKALWFVPLFSKDDLDSIPALHGLDFPTRSDVEA